MSEQRVNGEAGPANLTVCHHPLPGPIRSLDFSIAKQIHRRVDFNLSIDNLTDKHYFETQNFGESRLRPGDPVIARIHGTPGYPITVSGGITFRFSESSYSAEAATKDKTNTLRFCN